MSDLSVPELPGIGHVPVMPAMCVPQPPPIQPPPPLSDASAPLGTLGGEAGQKRAAALEDDQAFQAKARRVQAKSKCEHDRWKDGKCMECPCKHKVKRGECKEGCNEVRRNFCIHDRRKHGCKDCCPQSFCPHGKKKRRCRECTQGDPAHSDFCQHGRRKGQCKDCGGSQICEHNRQKFRCKECYMCVHYRVRSRCPDCIADEMKGVAQQLPRGQGWNIKRAGLESDGDASSPPKDGSRKDFRLDASGQKTGGPKSSENGRPETEFSSAAMGSVGEQAAGSEAEMKQQLEMLRAQQAQAFSTYFADKAKMQSEISRLHAENRELRALLAARGGVALPMLPTLHSGAPLPGAPAVATVEQPSQPSSSPPAAP